MAKKKNICCCCQIVLTGKNKDTTSVHDLVHICPRSLVWSVFVQVCSYAHSIPFTWPLPAQPQLEDPESLFVCKPHPLLLSSPLRDTLCLL